jgi:hypothetical protein
MVNEVVCLRTIGQSVLLLSSFISNNSKTKLLAESFLRFPIVECLERRFNAKDILLEIPHPFFISRRVDIGWNLNEKQCLMELKYISPTNTGSEAFLRIFYDIIRLAYSSLEQIESYFLLCGKADDFIKIFKSATIPTKNSDVLNHKYGRKRNLLNSILAQKYNKPQKIIKDNRFKDLYGKFCETYKCHKDKKFCKKLSFKTTLKYMSTRKESAISHTVAIWKIEVNKENN